MSRIAQMIVCRDSREVDEGTMGFHDYIKYKENFELFVERVSEIANGLEREIISISYPSEDMAVICYISNDGDTRNQNLTEN